MLSIYRKLYRLLDRRERQRGMLVLLLMLIIGLAESAGVASVLPFMAVVSNPQTIVSNRYLARIYDGMGFTSHSSFLLFLGVAVFCILIGSLFLRALGIWARLRFSKQRSHAWACRLLAGYLSQPYEWFLSHHSGELSASVLAEVNQVVEGSLAPGLQAVASAFVAAWLFALLLVVNPVLAVAATTLMGGLYGAVALGARFRLRVIGIRWRTAVRNRFRLLQETLGGIKDVKVMGVEGSYWNRFEREDNQLIYAQIASGLFNQLPSLAMQGILFGGVLLAVLYLMASHGDFERALPTLTLFAFAGYRLMPALQTIHQGVMQMRFTETVLDALREDLDSFGPVTPGIVGPSTPPAHRPAVREAIELRGVRYTYPGASHAALDDVTLRIMVRSTVGFVGTTGSGKSTAVDLLLGLLRPQVGALTLDGVRVTDDLVPAWQHCVGYVPQEIFLTDDTMAANIAFGVPTRKIDQAALERAARAAELHDFITGELPDGYATAVGERGVRLSGGQRQRVGIARALYRDPELLIFDEATSALDNLTEQAVMDAVRNLEGAKTIVLVAHRLSTVRSCDCIYLLEQGQIVASGSYEQLVNESPKFRALAELA